MAVGKWRVFQRAIEYIADNTIDLDGSIYRLTLHGTSAVLGTLASAHAISKLSQVGDELASARGYVQSGKSMAAPFWISGASAGEMRFGFTSSGVKWSANGGQLGSGQPGIQYAVVAVSGASAGAQKLVAWATLSTSEFNIADGSNLTIKPEATTKAIFEVNNA